MLKTFKEICKEELLMDMLLTKRLSRFLDSFHYKYY